MGEHQENRKVERAIQTIEGQPVTMRLAVEHIDTSAVSRAMHAGFLHNVSHVCSGGRILLEKREGRRLNRDLP